MEVNVVARFDSTISPNDDHPYRTGAWLPNLREYDATRLEVIGRIPEDLNGVYLRNTENPVHEAIGRYHPFDGDGMIHAMTFSHGRAEYRNRFIRTAGFLAEQQAGGALWAGLLESPSKSLRDGWGARTRMKDPSSTDVVVHAGRALTTFYQCGDAYRLDPRTLKQCGAETWAGKFPADWGISAHTKVDQHTGELMFFNYSKQAPYMHYGLVSKENELVHYVPIPLPGPRLPHDMAFTERYAILNDMPFFWDPELLKQDRHAVRYYPEIPARFAVIPRRGRPEDIRWFEASPTFVLHWINAYEDGDEIVLDGFHQTLPPPPPAPDEDDGYYARLFRYLDHWKVKTRPHRWRFNLTTGKTKEEFLADDVVEFGKINGNSGGRPYRYTYTLTNKPGWFLFDGLVKLDVVTGKTDSYHFAEGEYASEAPMAPRTGATGEDDGYLLTFTTDMANDRSECLVFSAKCVSDGPIARIRLPERISSGTHGYWAGADALDAPAR